MRITEKKLRDIIGKVISEMNPRMSGMSVVGHDHDMSSFMSKAVACCRMSKEQLLDMCRQICDQNHRMSADCCELCYCACRGDSEGCCICLERICSDRACFDICLKCCGC